MPSYAYKAYTERGQKREGRIEAGGTSDAEQALWLEGLKISAEPAGIRLEFSLPSGCYATVVLREFQKTP